MNLIQTSKQCPKVQDYKNTQCTVYLYIYINIYKTDCLKYSLVSSFGLHSNCKAQKEEFQYMARAEFFLWHACLTNIKYVYIKQ